jgi:DNA invertase Pin-like site-specific DNA recombinase
MSPKRVRTCALYVRISLSTEESVSIERQIEAGQQYAAARGWTVVGIFRDEGVSATHNKPEDRKGWQGLLAAREKYDAVVIWKVDRLARRVIDFLNANEAVKGRGAGIVAVEDPIDMTTAQGEAFAIMLAVFGQLEAATTRARVMAARDYLLRAGRYVGGALPYGYRKVENPNGAGFIIVQDEEQVPYLREMADRTLAGHSIYSTMKWLNAEGVPTKNGAAEWRYNTVDRLMRNPLLAGMVPHNPGHVDPKKRRGEDVVRDENGLPVIDESLAIMPVDQWRAMQAKLAEPNNRRAPRALRRKHSGVLSGLVWCGDERHEEPVRMWRGTVGSSTGPRPAYTCKECHQTLSNAEDLIVGEFLRERGELFRVQMVEEVHEGGSLQAREATIRLAELGREIVQASPERAAQIVAEMGRLKELQAAPAAPEEVVLRAVASDRTYAEEWAEAETDEERRAIIGDALDRVVVHRGKQGAWTDAAKLARCEFRWVPAGQVAAPTDEELASWAE